jgi:hypothetical protein
VEELGGRVQVVSVNKMGFEMDKLELGQVVL